MRKSMPQPDTTAPLDRPARRESLSLERFRQPEVADRPGIRWWWQTPVPPAELVRELRAIVDAGFGEVEIGFSKGFWANEPQRAALQAVLTEAANLGVGVAVTLGAEWPLRTPNTTTGTEHAAQEVQYGVHYFRDDQPKALALPSAFDDPDGSRPARLLAATAARVLRQGPPAEVVEVPIWTGEMQKEIRGPSRSTVLAEESLIDLMPSVSAGMLEWQPRDGDWAVFAFWARDTKQGVTSFLDRSAADAAATYLDEYQFGQANLELMVQAGTELFEDSLELNADSLFWSPGLIDRFVERHGYDPTPYLPLFFVHGMCRYWVPNTEPVPDFELDTGIGPRVRQDYYRLLTDMYISEHLLLLQEWSARRGLRHKSQVAYGQNLEPVRSTREFVRRGGRAEGESLNSGDRAPVDKNHPTWRFALDWQRSVVGGAHQGGAVRISTELGAQFFSAYAQTLGDLRQMLDKEWAAGITKPFVHGFASQEADAPWPTQSRFGDFIAESWNDTHFPEWSNWRPLTDYWARGTAVLETGTPRTDLAIYRDGFLTTAARGGTEDDATAPASLADTRALESAGYTMQYLDPIGLAEEGAIGGAGALFPNGPAYRGLIIDERAMTPEAAEAVARAAQLGLRVVIVGEAPSMDSGLGSQTSGDARVRDAVARALSGPTVVQVGSMAECAEAFKQLGLSPRAATLGTGGPSILTQWRESGNRRYVVVYNPESEPHAVEVSLEGAGGVSEMELITGDVRAVRHNTQDERTVIRTNLQGLGLRVFALDLEHAVTSTAPDVAEGEELPLTDWRLEVQSEEPSGPRTIQLDDQGPEDWRNVPALAGVSGAGRYSFKVRFPAGAGTVHAKIDLGEIGGSAIVLIDGRRFGPAYTSGTVLDLGDALSSSTDIEVEVRTPLRNAVVAHKRNPNVESSTCPQGLIGPVRIHTYDVFIDPQQ
jgi:hypothetical protein